MPDPLPGRFSTSIAFRYGGELLDRSLSMVEFAPYSDTFLFERVLRLSRDYV